MLVVLDRTEDLYKEESLPKEMFCSLTTLRAFMTDVLSTLSLVEEMFGAGFETILTGKMNQDPVEVLMQIFK